MRYRRGRAWEDMAGSLIARHPACVSRSIFQSTPGHLVCTPVVDPFVMVLDRWAQAFDFLIRHPLDQMQVATHEGINQVILQKAVRLAMISRIEHS